MNVAHQHTNGIHDGEPIRVSKETADMMMERLDNPRPLSDELVKAALEYRRLRCLGLLKDETNEQKDDSKE